MNIAQVLQYLGESVSREKRPFDYSGSVAAGTQAEYNLLTWNDTRPKPSWSTLEEAEEFATRWHARRAWLDGI